MMATEVILWWIALLLLLVGILHVSGFWYAEHGMKWSTMSVGVVQIILAIVVFTHPLGSLMLLTILIALAFMVEGLFKVIVALQNRHQHLPGWGLLFFSGLASVLLSFVVTAALPYSATYTIGILVGVMMKKSSMQTLPKGNIPPSRKLTGG